jgi:S-adenosylhomocysteine hydrolase
MRKEANRSQVDVCSILRQMVKKLYPANADTKEIFKDVLLVAVQHTLSTTVDLLSILQELGLKEGVVGGKAYSTHPESAVKIQQMDFTYVPDSEQLGYGRFDDCMREEIFTIWHKVSEKISQKKYKLMIILDDGADLLRSVPAILFNRERAKATPNLPEMIVGIEQTRGGSNHPLFHGLPFPIINVAGAFAKTQIEYPWVAEIVANKVIKLINENIASIVRTKTIPTIGIIGYGSMGKAVANKLTQNNFSVIVYEANKKNRNEITPAVHYDNAAVLMSNADVIIGCTGKDITVEPANLSALLYSKRNKWLISTGSKDTEFNGLLRIIQNETKTLGYIPNPLNVIQYENYVGGNLEILRGGFPINFTNGPHSVYPEKIWPTRAALLLACLTAIGIYSAPSRKYRRAINIFMLPTQAQLLIIKKYLELNSQDKNMKGLLGLTDKRLLDIIVKQSEGTLLDDIWNKKPAEI